MKKFLVLTVAFILMGVLSAPASADLIDDITLKPNGNGEVEAVVQFTVPIHYQRYFPRQKSTFVSVYFSILDSVPRDQWQNFESHRSPPSDLVKSFTVTTRDLNTGPRIDIQLVNPADFKVFIGRDGRSLMIRIKPDKAAVEKNGSMPAEKEKSALAPAAVAAVPVAPPPPPPASPAPPAAGKVLPSESSEPSPPLPAPDRPKESALIRRGTTQQLDGKDGLPPFPAIKQLPLDKKAAPPSESPALAELVTQATNQAAELMAKGRDALLVGEMFAAISAFNETLTLPPNTYTPHAQLWVGIARQKAGQLPRAVSEYQSYLKLYPEGASVQWVKDRLAKLKAVRPELFAVVQAKKVEPAKPQSTEFQTATYGSFSMYYYYGQSQIDTVTTAGAIQTPVSLTTTDQSSLISNVNATVRSHNNEFDNRLVFQDLYAANFLAGQHSQNRLNAAYYDLKNRLHDYSLRLGRQSALGGGVLGRFDGITAGYGFVQNWKLNMVTGRLSDTTIGPQPVFIGAGLDFGINSPIGGTFYGINQTVGGIPDRKAVGGNLRYFDQGKTILALLDYDVRIGELNIITVQGTLNGDNGMNYNFLLDSRKTPSLGLRSAVNGTTASIETLLQNGWTEDDLILLVKQRTATSNVAQFGITNQFRENWQMGADVVVSNTSGLQESGVQFTDPFTGVITTGLDGFVPGTPASGNTWTFTGRLTGSNIFSRSDITMGSASYTKGNFITGTSLILNNRTNLYELWVLDGTLRLYWQSDNTGGKLSTIAPQFRVGYRMRSNLMLETEVGIDWTSSTPNTLVSSKSNRKFFSSGFRLDF